ncbi:MAG: acyltransferase family protein [Candidatus Promineifilaceae bacterium]
MAKRLLLLNGIAIAGIVLHHAAAYALQAMFEWTDRYLPVAVPNYDQLGSLPYYGLMVVRLLMTAAVPAFFFVSGYFVAFMARGGRSRVTLNMVTPRIKVLLIPFLIWTALRYVLLRRLPTSLDDILNPYHFIPLLIQFYLLAPLMVDLARRDWKLLLAPAALFQLVGPVIRVLSALLTGAPLQEELLDLPRWLFLVGHPFWFPFGIVAGLYLSEARSWLARQRKALLAAVILLGGLVLAEYWLVDAANGQEWLGPGFSGIAHHLFSFALILYVLALEPAAVPLSRHFSQLGTQTLGIYLMNIPAVYVAAVLMYRLTPALLGYQLVYFALLVLVGLGVPLLLMRAVRRSPARVGYRYLFG